MSMTPVRTAALALTAGAPALATAAPAGAADLPPARGHEVPAAPLSIVNAVSNEGVVGGATGATVAALWYPDRGQVRELGVLVGTSSLVEYGPTSVRQFSRGVVWTPGRAPVDIGGLGGDTVEPAAIDADGEVAGVATTADGTRHVFRWSRRTGLSDLGTVGADVHVAGLTDRGMIVGQRRVGTDPNLHRARPFLHTPGCGFRDPPYAPDPEGSAFVSAVDDHGQIYGSVHDAFADSYRIFAWDAARPPC